ncbi:VPS28 protein-domain-containing protein [Lobosporangium transversale]|uniref:Vacuolar protein sorting-associated protein 28 n=1 Tax=Lobosporangium transversale TaxID=64571 RepID=A0A1Y2G896_9FUNG|nr:VPS28 protein-domain-containing protein [Lobosporangium transversale]ORY99531.1 VPS28 protein-domain-containing protein [Lobosporangium transversale]|eukprot:XP_021875857.1 VPS28 protein-domain-containing protein [Lobosporangium transversale]
MAFTSTQQYLASVNGSSSPSSSFPSASFGGTSSGSRVVPAINLDEEIRLTTNNRERAQMDNMADLYSIIVVLEHLEMAYIRSAITHTQYTPECRNLIAQYRTASNLLGDIDLEKFMKEYNLDCPAAAKRIKIGVPATVEFGDGGASDEPNGHRTAKYVAETVQSYITVVDLLKLGRTAVDEIHPHLAELMQSLNNVRSLPADFEGRAKVREWLIKLNSMKASDQLTTSEKRQLEFDLESNYTAFRGWLDSQ